MVFNFKKNKPAALSVEKLQLLSRLFQEYPSHQENFLESLPHLLKLVDARGGAVFLYEAKTDVFLLKTWGGTKPSRFTLSADYEIIKFLQLHQGPITRQEFVQSGHELRQSALFFFQQTCATKAYPVCQKKGWVALVTLDFEKETSSDQVTDQILALYSEQLKYWVLYQGLEEKTKKLSELGHVKSQLLANVTHELQTPLNGILGISEALLHGSDVPVPEALRSALEHIYKSGKELHSTVDNILKLIQIEAHKAELRFEKVNIHSLIEEVVALYYPALSQKKIDCVVPSADRSFEVFVEPDQIRTVLMNLMGNAIKFTQNGRVQFELNKNGEMLHVTLTDTGIGIDEDKLELIFEEFYQADGSHTRLYGGTGLGLAIVKKIVSLHGGRIWADSKRGHGARFTFTVPLFPGQN